MKHYYLIAILVLFLFTTACELTPGELETTCLPTRISMTLVQGSQTHKILADFYYQEETNLLDHITWSNHQTHYFEYDERGRLKVVRMMKVDIRVQEERWFVYDDLLLERVDLVKRNLDYTYLEPLDSIFTGYVEYEYEGEQIIEESEYEISQEGHREEYVRNVSYTYDKQGNLLSLEEMDPRSGESNQVSMAYDQTRHPYHALSYYFEGNSHVNNMLSKFDEESGLDYTYNMLLNEHEYPETIYEKLGSSYTRIISYSYQID